MNFEHLTQEEIARVLQAVPVDVRLALMRETVVLAGGVIRDTLAGLPIKDVDIFCHSEYQAQKLALRVSGYVRHTTFAYSVTVDDRPVQFVFYKDFEDAKDLVRQFDFRACCAGIYWNREKWGSFYTDAKWVGVAVEGFHADCASRVLHFMSQPKDADKLTALRRAVDFTRKGWSISNAELAGIVSHFAPELDRERVRHSFRPAYGGRR